MSLSTTDKIKSQHVLVNKTTNLTPYLSGWGFNKTLLQYPLVVNDVDLHKCTSLEDTKNIQLLSITNPDMISITDLLECQITWLTGFLLQKGVKFGIECNPCADRDFRSTKDKYTLNLFVSDVIKKIHTPIEFKGSSCLQTFSIVFNLLNLGRGNGLIALNGVEFEIAYDCAHTGGKWVNSANNWIVINNQIAALQILLNLDDFQSLNIMTHKET